jgi:hypothetical protein
MKNTEKDYISEQKSNSIMNEKTNQDFNKRNQISTAPNEIEGKPAVTLPIIGEATPPKETPDNNKADETIEADDIDSGNNYTAAENENQTNSTL